VRVTKGFRIVRCVSQITALAAMRVAAQAAKTPILLKKENRLYSGVDEQDAHPNQLSADLQIR
jgi:hypothetical protein